MLIVIICCSAQNHFKQPGGVHTHTHRCTSAHKNMKMCKRAHTHTHTHTEKHEDAKARSNNTWGVSGIILESNAQLSVRGEMLLMLPLGGFTDSQADSDPTQQRPSE